VISSICSTVFHAVINFKCGEGVTSILCQELSHDLLRDCFPLWLGPCLCFSQNFGRMVESILPTWKQHSLRPTFSRGHGPRHLLAETLLDVLRASDRSRGAQLRCFLRGPGRRAILGPDSSEDHEKREEKEKEVYREYGGKRQAERT
jgi:hypothetical protein